MSEPSHNGNEENDSGENQPFDAMNFKTLLPFGVLLDETDVLRIVVETTEGLFGILPHRLDCAATLVPGILTYETVSGDEVFVAVDEGTLVKTGPNVLVSVRRAFIGSDLNELKNRIKTEFLEMDDHERDVRQVMAKLEVGILKRFAAFKNE